MTATIAPGAVTGFLSALDYAREGMQRGVASFEEVAASVAGAVANPAAISARNEVAALSARNQVAANARVFETGNQLLGTLLDLRA